MRFLVFVRTGDKGEHGGDLWEQVGVADAPEDGDEAGRTAEEIAVEQAADGGGVWAALPFANWMLMNVEQELRISPVMRGVPPVDDDREPTPAERQEEALREEAEAVRRSGGIEEMDGLIRPAK